MNYGTNTVMDDKYVHASAKTPPWDELVSWISSQLGSSSQLVVNNLG